MPPRPFRECRKPGCKALTQDASGVCTSHSVWFEEQTRSKLQAQRKACDDRRGSANERGYSAAWRKAREGFLRSHPMCMEKGCFKPSIIVDHIIPHRGDKDLFWDRENWQALCKTCHDRKTARGE